MTENSLTYEDDRGEEGLLVVVDAPLALEGEGQQGEDHHLHAVRHPAQAHDEAENYLKFSEADVIDRLGDREGVVRDHAAGRRPQLDLRPDHVEVGRGAPPEGVVPLPLTGHGEEVGVRWSPVSVNTQLSGQPVRCRWSLPGAWPGTSQEGDIPLLNTEISQHQPTIFFISMLSQYRHVLLGHSGWRYFQG